MNIFGVLTMAGGLALFLYGMNVMGDSLAKLSGGKLEQILEKLTCHNKCCSLHKFLLVLTFNTIPKIVATGAARPILVRLASGCILI